MSNSALSSIVGLIPVGIASGIAVQTTKALHPNGKTKRAKKVERKLKKKKMARKVKRVTKSRMKKRDELKRWLG